ncbi:30S ribosomal protein S4 [Candidatus Woesearchaeota archaeon CG10_big_fil_rev_8_21_14_0_10_34_12]|nr:MAG: 30S ribosomal protein S4 [Candidatus Woesearchaeota archaeon CG10_big_fil_rev_8_21_14_0_10_34_12]
MSWIRKKKKYSKPKKLHDSVRRDEENITQKKYGLKNKREIWKVDSKLKKIKGRAKNLITKPKEQKNFFEKLGRIGLKVSSIEEVLALTRDNLLGRRLQSLVFKNGIAKTVKGARQMVVHKTILVNGKVVNIPSYIVPVEFEESIEIRLKQKKKKGEKLIEIKDLGGENGKEE